MEAILAVASVVAGCLGALTGLGGGVIIVPLLVLGFGIDLRYAIGASLVCIIATSSGAAASYVREGYTNVRIGMFLEVATTFGALTGAFVAGHVSKSIIGVLFGALLMFSAYHSVRPKSDEVYQGPPDALAKRLRLSGSFPGKASTVAYNVTGTALGFVLMYFAGVLSALLGVGGGAVKVIAMDNAMRIPFKVSTTTSNFMIGVTAAASSGVYLGRGYIDPVIAAPVMVGILCGSIIGAKLLPRLTTKSLRWVFAVVICFVGMQMMYKGISGTL